MRARSLLGCAVTEDIRERFGLENALDYLMGEKIFSFVTASERDPDFAAELQAFITEIPPKRFGRISATGHALRFLPHQTRI